MIVGVMSGFYLEVSVDEVVDLKILVVVSERVEQCLCHLKTVTKNDYVKGIVSRDGNLVFSRPI